MKFPKLPAFTSDAEHMMKRKGVQFLHCAECGDYLVAIYSPAEKLLVGIGCPKCKVATNLVQE